MVFISFYSFNEKDIHVLDKFEFEHGRVLENVEVSYTTYGIPKYDEDGYIVNAVLFFSTFSEQFSFLYSSHHYIKDNSDFKDDDFFFIDVGPLGYPDSCSPSTTGLRNHFPHYTILDMVNFQRQFLAEKFKFKKILGLIGEGVGGFQVLTWACEYPDDMDFIFVLNSSAKFSGYKYLIAKVMENIINSSDDIDSNEYSSSLSKILVSINSLLFAHSSSKESFNNMHNYQLDVILDEFIDDGFFRDVHDIKIRNECNLQYDIEDKISNIKAKSLFVSTNDNFFNYKLDMIPLNEKVKDSILLRQEYEKEDYYFSNEEYDIIGTEVISFLSQFVEK